MFETTDASRVVEWAAAEFGGKNVLMSSSFGADSAVLLHMVTQVVPDIKVVFVNTGYLFPQTHAHMEALRLRLNLNIWVYRTRNDPIAYLREAGEENPSWRNDVDRCCAANKNEPFELRVARTASKGLASRYPSPAGFVAQRSRVCGMVSTIQLLCSLSAVKLGPTDHPCLLEKARFAVPPAVRTGLRIHWLQSPQLHPSDPDRGRFPRRSLERKRQG